MLIYHYLHNVLRCVTWILAKTKLYIGVVNKVYIYIKGHECNKCLVKISTYERGLSLSNNPDFRPRTYVPIEILSSRFSKIKNLKV